MYSRICPRCEKEISYKLKTDMERLKKKNSLCIECFRTYRKQDSYSRICPWCGREILYTLKGNRDRLREENRPCKECWLSSEEHRANCVKAGKTTTSKYDFAGDKNPFFGKVHSDETRSLISKKRKGQRNSPETEFGMNGVINKRPIYEIWVEKYGKQQADAKFELYREKQSIANSGTNNSMYGKPSPLGSGNGWSGWYKGWFFRSFRELMYMINEIEKNNRHWISAEAKEYRIDYMDYAGVQRSYFADFLVDHRYLVECKPKRLFNSYTVQQKKIAGEKFCETRGWEYSLVDPGKLSNETIMVLHDSGAIRLTERYEKKYQERKCQNL